MGISIKRRKFSTRNLYDRRLLIYHIQIHGYQHIIHFNRKERKEVASKLTAAFKGAKETKD